MSLQRLAMDGRLTNGKIPEELHRECDGNPYERVRTCAEPCGDDPAALHMWARHPCWDAVTCVRCQLTYLGGPTVVTKSEEL